MIQTDLRILSTALAFVTVVTNGQMIKPVDATDRILALADQIREFCELHVLPDTSIPALTVIDEQSAATIDRTIEHHIKELRESHETILPKDKETLLKFYDRLQQRHSRRAQRNLYATITDSRLADLVLSYLDDEIADKGGLT